VTELNARCPHCNRSLPPDSRFCPRCGLPTNGDEQVTPQEPVAERPFLVELVDKAWDFFASTRVAVVLIILLALASIGGSLVEQESNYQDWRPPYLYYPFRYGETLGPLLMKLGLTHAYTSIWFLTLVWLLVVSLVVCSLHRLIPLHKVLTRPQVKKDEHFVRRQQVVFEKSTAETNLEELAALFKKRGFRIWRQENTLHADRGRISRYGPYILHIGLIVVAIAATLKALPGWDVTKSVWIADGETAAVEGLDWQLKSNRFIMELYPNGMPKEYATDLEIIQDGQVVKTGRPEVNHPVNWDQYDIYQASFRREYGTATFSVMVGTGQQAVKVGTVTMDLRTIEPEYQVTPNLKLVVAEYFNHVGPGEDGRPTNLSPNVSKPLMRVEFQDAQGQVLGVQALAFAELPTTPSPGEKIEAPATAVNGPIQLVVDDWTVRWYTGLQLHKDLTTPYMFLGLGIVLFGLGLTFFVFHQQIWVVEAGDTIVIGARTYKNVYSLKQYMRRLLQAEPLPDRTQGKGETEGAPAPDSDGA
jgi:cytochrome c biogenesis protein